MHIFIAFSSTREVRNNHTAFLWHMICVQRENVHLLFHLWHICCASLTIIWPKSRIICLWRHNFDLYFLWILHIWSNTTLLKKQPFLVRKHPFNAFCEFVTYLSFFLRIVRLFNVQWRMYKYLLKTKRNMKRNYLSFGIKSKTYALYQPTYYLQFCMKLQRLPPKTFQCTHYKDWKCAGNQNSSVRIKICTGKSSNNCPPSISRSFEFFSYTKPVQKTKIKFYS